MTDRTSVNGRELALDILMEILERGGFSHVVLGQALGKYQYLDKQDRAFVTRVVEGTLEYRLQIDYILDRYSRTKTENMKPLIRSLLRMSVYQILYMDRVPDSAVCNEAVKLAEKRRFGGLKGFVNGVLRTVSRNKDRIVYPDDSVRYSMPSWLIRMWETEWGPEAAKNMLKAFLEERPICVRCNLDLASAETAAASLREQGVRAERHPLAEDCLYLWQVDAVERLEAFQKGWIQVQDFTSSCVARAAGIRASDIVLDVCGAPGGKAVHAASLLCRAEAEGLPRNVPAADAAGPAGAARTPTEDLRHTVASAPAEASRGHVYVRDLSERKVGLIGENVRRCGYDRIVTAGVWDARVPDPSMYGRADVVFADLPCSGLGVIGRKPDIKYRVMPEDIDELAALQREILSVVWQYVKPGGLLIYSTCTVSRRENEENMFWFLDHYPFVPEDIRGRLGDGVNAETLKDGYIRFLPGETPDDGFFLSVMKRTEPAAE